MSLYWLGASSSPCIAVSVFVVWVFVVLVVELVETVAAGGALGADTGGSTLGAGDAADA